MQNKRKTGSYIGIPAEICFPLVPIPKKRPNLELEGALPHQVEFPLTSVDSAEDLTRGLIRKCERFFRAGSPEEITRILDDHPSLALDSQIRKILVKLAEHGRLRNPCGRPRSRFKEHPLVVVALVKELILQGKVPNQEMAFHWLGKIGMAYSTARDLYYRAHEDSRFQTLFIKHPEHTHEATAEEVRFIQQGKPLAPGIQVSMTMHHSVLGEIEVTLKAP